MNKTKHCFKCHHVATFEGAQPMACPECGAIYSKVEQAAQEGLTMHQPSRKTSPVRRPQTIVQGDVLFINQLRGESNYPNFRIVVKFWYWFGLVIGVLLAIGGAFTLFRGDVTPGLIGIAVAIAIVFFSKVAKEISLMVADLSDAAVRLAAQAKASA